MMSIEEYIAKRKQEDNLQEFDKNKRQENTKICVNYIFEYFNNYLDIPPEDEKTILHNMKVNDFRKRFEGYSVDVQNWIVQIYNDYGKHIHLFIKRMITDAYFFLYDTDAEFRSISYEIYPKLIKKYPFIKGQDEMLYKFLKDYHRVKRSYPPINEFQFISDPINEWIEQTNNKYEVNLLCFANDWADYFFDHKDIWSPTCKIRHDDGYIEYDYKKKSNLFNIDSLYRNMPKKTFTRGRKQEFEVIIMSQWLSNTVSDKKYWLEYLNVVLPNM